MSGVKLCVWCQVMFVRPITYEILQWSEYYGGVDYRNAKEINEYYRDEGNS